MNDLWRDIFKDIDRALIDSLTLDRVLVARTGDKLVARFFSPRLLTDREFSLISKALRGAFPGTKASLRVSYPALREDVKANIAGYARFICGLIARELPSAMPYLRWEETSWKNRGGALIAQVDRLGVDYLTSQGVDRRVEQLLKELFGVEMRVVLEPKGDEEARLQEIARRREEEQERMAELARKACAADANGASCKAFSSRQLLGKAISQDPVAVSELSEGAGRVTVRGEVVKAELRDLKNGSKICSFALTDYTGTVACKAFVGGRRVTGGAEAIKQQADNLMEGVRAGRWVRARGDYRYDEYQREMVLMVSDLTRAETPRREDEAAEKRVELHLHTQMSAMDACASPTELIKQAARWGHPAVAITDHGVVQAFPEAFAAAKKAGIKLIPGCEGYLIDDRPSLVKNADARRLSSAAFVVLDVETTGLYPARDAIIELGAVRYEGGVEVAEFSQLINPMRPLSAKIIEITGITDSMLSGMPTIDQVAASFHQFCAGAVLAAHNADFDMAFVSRALAKQGLALDHPVIDTLSLSRNIFRDQKSHKLSAVCKRLGISLKNAHRAVHDARATAQALVKMLSMLDESRGLRALSDLNQAFDDDAGGVSRHIILLAATQQGMTNLYRLVSQAHLNYFRRTPRLPRSLIEKYREGLIIGSACEAGELFRAVLEGKGDQELERIAKFYDYLEIQPIGNNEFLLREGAVASREALQDINRKILALGDRLNIPVAATGDVHFKEPRDAIFRAILMNAKGFEDCDHQPPLYLRTTDDMLAEFAYLGEQDARRVVVEAPRAIAQRVSPGLRVFVEHPEGAETFQPYWDFAEEDIRTLTETRARQIYGEPLPQVVRARIDKELGSIIGYGFSTLYDIAVKLVQKSLADGYIVGSRGSVGSSFVANMTGITEVNSLPPHYVCPRCKHSEFDVPEECACGLDLPLRDCPVCATNMDRDGFDIPFEVFLGFKGDKVPDIDLNFSGEYQPVAHAYVKELFGPENVFRAGTIGTVAEKTAYGYVLKYLEEREMTASAAEKERLVQGITGAKRTTGQHPAGMVVLPKGYEIYQFTPIQRPADDMDTDTVTTHFDFSSMHDVLVKLDILGHDDPTMLKKLEDMTGIAPQAVPLGDRAVFERILSLFTGPEALGVTAEEIGVPTGTLGIPEFGTRFVRQMLVDTQPRSMEELIRISGLSHGTDVWLGNAQDIIRSGTAPLRKCICTRDDIMNQLIKLGVESKTAFAIMESVRKGRGLKPEWIEAMRAANTPDWFIESCQKIKYMFPKAHAVAYVLMALRIAYFKVYHPGAYYACYLRRNAESFDGSTMVTAPSVLRAKLEELQALDKEEKAKKEDQIGLIEVLIEMMSRGIGLRPVSLYESHAENFLLVDEGTILPPLSSMPGVGLSAAESLARAREDGPFISQEDMIRRKVAKSVVQGLAANGVLSDLPQTSQISLFDFE
jgi:DNA polymerase-3 subunit alpha (Gram-positive type)